MIEYLIVPVSKPRKGHLQRLSVSLSAELKSTVEIAEKRLIPSGAAIPGRDQYNSTEIVRRLAEEYADFPGKVLGVTELDLAIPILTYVFGEAQVNGRAAVISTHRLDPRYYGLPKDEALYERRILAEALHELGHTFGLHHCKDWNCVMRSANDVDEIDIRGDFYCPRCHAEVIEDGEGDPGAEKTTPM